MRHAVVVFALAAAGSSVGCASMQVVPVSENPVVIPCSDFEFVWQQTVEVVDEYFDIASENRIDGRIETYPQVSATLLEPWRRDSVDRRERLEASCQTLRRRAFVHLSPVADGYAVQVEVYRELEDLPHPAYANTGDATFRTEQSLHREHDVIGPIPVARGWIPAGREWKLESKMLADLGCRFGIQ